MQPCIFIHIGTTRTGTTSIQKFLAANRLHLQQQNLVFPTCTKTANNAILSYYATLNDAPYSKTHFWQKNEIIEFPGTLKAEIIPHIESGKNIVFTNEALFKRLKTDEQFARLKSIFEPYKSHTIKIIVYLRRQDDHLISFHTTGIRKGKKTTIDFNKIDDDLFYDVMLDRFAHFFGKENLVVKIYDGNKFIEGKLIKNFLNVLGVKPNENFNYLQRDNRSLDAYQIQFFELLNRYSALTKKNNTDYLIYNDLLTVLLKNSTQHKYKPDAQKRLAFLNTYKASNERLKQIYFPQLGAGESVFEDFDIAKYENEAYKLTAEKAVEIAALLLKHKEKL